MHLPLLTLLVGICPLLGLAVPHAGVAQPRSSAIRGKYLVALKPESSPAQVREHASWVQGVHARNLRKRQSPGETAAGVERTFSFDGFRGYSGSFDEETVEDIKRSKDVSLDILRLDSRCRVLTGISKGGPGRAGPEAHPRLYPRRYRRGVKPVLGTRQDLA